MILRTKYKIRCTFLKNKLLQSSGKVALKYFMNKRILCEYYYLEVAELKYSLAYTIKLPSHTLVVDDDAPSCLPFIIQSS